MMNPSRITTPLDKKFDEWWLRFRDRPLKYDIYIRRTRDIEAESSRGDGTTTGFACDFYAIPNDKSLAKINEPTYPRERVEAKTYEELRAKVLSMVSNWLNAQWEKVIVIYMEGANDQMAFDNSRLILDQNALKFDYTVCFRSKDGVFWKKPDSTFVTRRMGDMVLSFSNAGSCHWVPWNEATEQSLADLRNKFKTLASGLRQLVFERTDEFVKWSRSNPQPLLNA